MTEKRKYTKRKAIKPEKKEVVVSKKWDIKRKPLGPNYVWKGITEKRFRQLTTGKATLEIKVPIKNGIVNQVGHVVLFPEHDRQQFYPLLLIDIRIYESIEELLEEEDVSKILPDMTRKNAIKALRNKYSDQTNIHVHELAITSSVAKGQRVLFPGQFGSI
jgi:Uncharacterized conserved protein